MSEFSEDECTVMAAAIAYYAMFSIPPLFVIVINATGAIWGEQAVRGHVDRELASILGEGGKDQILDMMRSSRISGGGLFAKLVSPVLLFIGATGVMVQLQTALNRVWEIEPDRTQGSVKSFLVKRSLSLAMVTAIAFLLLASLILTAILSSVMNTVNAAVPGDFGSPLALVTHFSVTFIVITLLMAALFKWLPDAEIQWNDVWVGAAVTTILFMVGKELLGWYLGRKDPNAYGTAGALVLLLMWIYYTTLILLLGAEFTQVWARSKGRRIAPVKGAVQVVREKRVTPPHGPPGAPMVGHQAKEP